MKNFIGTLAIAFCAFNLSASSNVDNKSALKTQCGQQAIEYGEFMAGHGGLSGAEHAIAYYETFCT